MSYKCKKCTYEYPFADVPSEVEKLKQNLQGLCPACFEGKPSPIVRDAMRATLIREGVERDRFNSTTARG